MGEKEIAQSASCYIIAEMSGNHNQNFDTAVEIIHAAKAAGTDAIKLQTYTPDTITIDSSKEYFQISGGTVWDSMTLYELYKQAYTPWEWQPKLKAIANSIGLECFSSPFDHTAVDFLETMNVPAYKIASFEIVDIPLIQRIAKTGKPIILSTGMASLDEITEAVNAIKSEGNDQIVLLKCTSAYPAPPEEMNLRTILHLAETFGLPVGLSDHSIGIAVPIAAVAMGACVIEKHFTLSRELPGSESEFALEPEEFKEMVDSIRIVEKAMGSVNYELTEKQTSCVRFRRSLFVVHDVDEGEVITEKNVRSIRPSDGLHTRYLRDVIGKKAKTSLAKGTPLNLDLII